MTPQFKSAVETYGPRFMADLSLTRLQVGGIFGNLAVESDQFRALQEYKPTVKGSKGGWGWPQWTGYGKGGRRGLFEAWADSNGFKRDDPEAFYGFMLVELRGSEKAALARLKRTTTLDTATEAFMKGYERPGVPHLDKRKAFALEALRVLDAKIGTAPVARPAPKPVSAPPIAIEAPRVQTVSPVPASTPWWQRIFGVKAKPASATVVRPGLRPNGDPALWDVQAKLREKAYYTKGSLDGLDGGLTQSAVAQIRKDNHLGDGGIDAEFLAALDSFPQRPVSIQRQHMSLPAAAAHAPELFKPPGWLVSAGLGSLGLGGASGAGLMDNVQTAVAKGNDVFGQVQSAFGLLASVVAFVVEHKTWFLVAVGLFLVWKGVSAILNAWIKVRSAFF